MRVLLVDQNPERAAELIASLEKGGCEVVGRMTGNTDLVKEILRLAPDIIIVDLASPDRDTIEQMGTIALEQPKPVLMFCDEAEPDLVRRAIRSGVSAYVFDGTLPSQVRPFVNMAIAQFEAFQALRDEVATLRLSLSERKTIEKAKGLLMSQRGMTEDHAYRELRKLAMDRGRKLGEVAEDVIALMKLLSP
jgi:response regulator NasT